VQGGLPCLTILPTYDLWSGLWYYDLTSDMIKKRLLYITIGVNIKPLHIRTASVV
jgi:hypothetical protein